MAKSNKKGNTEKAKKVESKRKSPPKSKSTAKPKAVLKIKKAVKSPKKIPKVAPLPKKVVAKVLKKSIIVKKVVAKQPVKNKIVAKKALLVNSNVKPKALKPVKTKTAEVKDLKNKKDSSEKVTTKNTGNFELTVVLRTGRRPEAIIGKKKLETDIMSEDKLRYSEEELKEFEVLIVDKLDKAKKELVYMKEMLSKKNDYGTDNTGGTMKLLEDGADTLEKENFSQLAVRQQKFVTQLENAVARIKNGTYGVCIDTGKLIPKERLKAVPHTQHSIEAKLNRR